eukprot:jgi/Botrbrau1/20653/Bobra.113_1s0077.1
MCHGPLNYPKRCQMTAGVLGFSLRFPESKSPSVFWTNLMNRVDMQTSDDRRWPRGLHDTPPRTGKAPDLDLFDNAFFSIHGKQAQKMDPQLRKLLETGYEAWIDSGVDFNYLRGSDKVGVYVGACSADAHAMWLDDIPNISGYEQTGCASSMLANRLSWFFDFQGPSKVVDTACSSSLVALHDAITDMALGRIDFAMVGGASAILRPAMSVAFNRLKMLSPDAACKSFSAGGNGYTRSDGVSVLILGRRGLDSVPFWTPKPPIATIVGIAVNNDGFTKESITFPSQEAQRKLSRQVCKESGIHPSEIVYVEAHGTGTVVGDAEELASIDAVYGSGDGQRTPGNPLLIGSVKSNMGHCEGGSGLAAIIKVLMAFENGVLPPNLHYEAPNPSSKSLNNGTLQVVTTKTPFPEGTVAINNFGFGGTNVHMLIQRSPDLAFRNISFQPPTGHSCGVLPLASRTQDGIRNLVDKLKQVAGGPFSLAGPLTCLANTVARNHASHPHRAAILPSGDVCWSKATPHVHEEGSTPVWFAFSGNGSQWSGMASELYKENATFKGSMASCAKVLEEKYGFDLLQNFEIEKGWGDLLSTAVGLTAVQIGLVDVLVKDYKVKPAGIIGHSAGEIAAGYADNALSLEQTVCIAYERAFSARASSKGDGLMAAVGLSAQEADALLKQMDSPVVVACDNSPNSVTLSGRAQNVREILDMLRAKNVFVREVDTRGIAYHTAYLDDGLPQLQAALERIVPHPKQRSENWITSSFSSNSVDISAKTASAGFQVHGYRHKVLFRQACEQVPADVIMLEIGPHSILKSMIRQCRPDLTYVPTLEKGKNGVTSLHEALAALWNNGATVAWPTQDLDDTVEVPRAIREALVAWDHRSQFPLPTPVTSGRGMFSFTYDLGGEHSFLADHLIDGRIIMPVCPVI